MKTYQDFLEIADRAEDERIDFVRQIINDHKASKIYEDAAIAQKYYDRRNVTMEQFQKLLYTMTGQAVPDNFSANWKMKHGFFHIFVTQEVQHLLGNGITWKNETTASKLGEDIDTKTKRAATAALIGAESFGFFNLDHVEVFKITEFVPLYDEEDGALKAGVRFWQIDSQKPLRATLYEMDGYTDYIYRHSEGEVLNEKRPYILKVKESKADGTEIYDFSNYPTFPIVPLWADDDSRMNALQGIREQIDCYDLIKSGFANDVDDASLIYWTIQNGGGMDDVDLARFVERMHTVKAAVVDADGATAEAHTMDVPSESRERLLDRLKDDLYMDAMALDLKNISGGATTATQIIASYKPLDSKCDDLEYSVLEWLKKLCALAGIEDEKPTFTRDYIVNKSEEIQTIVQSAQFLTEDYVITKIMTILGDGDQAEALIRQRMADDLSIDYEDNEPQEEETAQE